MGGKRIELPKNDFTAVEVWSPESGSELVKTTAVPEGDMCSITVTTEDSFAAASRFDNVCFAIYGKEDGRNYLSFKKTFGT